MKFSKCILSVGLSLGTVIPFVSLSSTSASAAEQTLLLCEGNTRITARVYQSNSEVKMRLFDRRTGKVTFDSAVQSATNPETVTYTNIRGEGTYRVSQFRNAQNSCSITIGNQPAEQGTVKGGGTQPSSNEKTLLLCEGSTRTTARVYQSNGELKMRLFDRQTNKTWFNSAVRSEMNPETVTYTNIRGEGTYRVSQFRNAQNSCSITIGNQPTEQGKVK
jgi:hypothetical protein